MSFILEALKKAEAERRQGLTATSDPAAPAEEPKPRRRGLFLLLALALLVNAALLAWWLKPWAEAPAPLPEPVVTAQAEPLPAVVETATPTPEPPAQSVAAAEPAPAPCRPACRACRPGRIGPGPGSGLDSGDAPGPAGCRRPRDNAGTETRRCRQAACRSGRRCDAGRGGLSRLVAGRPGPDSRN